MGSLLHMAIWVGMVILFMRFVRSLHNAESGHKTARIPDTQASRGTKELHWISPEYDIDPVCKRTIGTNIAKTNVYAGNVYHFCSRDCREVFEAAPKLYTNAGNKKPKRPEQAHV